MKKLISYFICLALGLLVVFFLGDKLIECIESINGSTALISILKVVLFIAFLGLGLFLIVKGGDLFVDAATWMAKVSGLPTFVIGATVVSIATTLPEILVSSIGSAQGSINLAIGNAVGSVNANIALIMGVSLVFIPGLFVRKTYMPKAIILLVAIATLWVCTLKGQLILGLAFLILAIFICFIIENLMSAKRSSSSQEKTEKYKPENKQEIIDNIIFFVCGAAGIVIGAMLLSTYGEDLAMLLGTSAGVDTEIMSGIVGVTIIAVGTSLPELTTTIIAIKKKQSDLSVGNIIGANIIDITLILPLCSFISGGSLPVSMQTRVIDLPFCLLVASIALVPAMITGKFKKWQGLTLLSLYVCYLAILMLTTFNVISIY